MRGRKPKPTAIRKLEGNPGKRALNEAEPQLDPNRVPTCPTHVRGPARDEWQRISRELQQAGILTVLDRAALAAYCTWYGRWVEAEDGVRKFGMLVAQPQATELQATLFGVTPPSEPNPAALAWNPYLAIANKSMTMMLKFLVEFGMTPSSRTRIHGLKQEERDEFEEFIGGQQTEADEVYQ